MTILERSDGSVINLIIEGRIDANTSAKLQEAILKAFKENKDLVLDFALVPYLSSAGLRALLIGQKTAMSKQRRFSIINASGVALQVIQSVGFHKVIEVN